jgi:recombination protein RecA
MAVATLHRRFGPQVLVKGAAARRDGRASVPHIPTGFPDLDRVLGIGGLPRGKVCEVAGPATSGKTTLAIKFLAQAQVDSQVGAPSSAQVAYIDQALYFDPDYAHRCGLDLSRLIVGQPADTKEALAMTEALARSGQLTALVFDALDFFWTDPAVASRLAATLNRLPAPLARSGTILLVLHEAPDSVSPALSALAHSAAVRLRVVREGWLRRQGDVRGYKARVEVLKNRLGPAGRTASIRIEFNGTVRGNGL